MSIKDLINAIDSGNASKTQDAFESIMAEKISSRLDDMRIEVAQNMFTTEAACGTKMKKEAACDEDDELEEAKDGWSKNDSLAKPVTSGQAMANHSQYFTKVTRLDSDGNPKKPEKPVKVNKESEQIDEISLNKASDAYAARVDKSRRNHVNQNDRDKAEKTARHIGARYGSTGLVKAKRKSGEVNFKSDVSDLHGQGARVWADEEVEQIDEISLNKASDAYAARYHKVDDPSDDKLMKTKLHIASRYGSTGVNKAIKKTGDYDTDEKDVHKAFKHK
jgi:hypothetical protein